MLQIVESPHYNENRDRANGKSLTCIVCGKNVPSPRYHVHLHCGGGTVVTEEEAASLPACEDLGMYPIGADCLRLHPEYRPYVEDSHRRVAKATKVAPPVVVDPSDEVALWQARVAQSEARYRAILDDDDATTITRNLVYAELATRYSALRAVTAALSASAALKDVLDFVGGVQALVEKTEEK